MNRKFIHSVLTCLLCLLPVSTIAQTLTQLEYWFDGDRSTKQTIKLSGKEDVVDTKINTSSLSSGTHELFYRVRQSNGKYSGISTARFNKFGLGDSKLLEYWVDGSTERHRVSGVTPSDDGDVLEFDQQLNLSRFSPGYHRLYCRVVSQDGHTSSSVMMTPILVKSQYDNLSAADVNVEGYSISVDDGEPMQFELAKHAPKIGISHVLDTRKLTAGQHTLHTKVWNNLGVGVNEEDIFTVEKPDAPQLTLSHSVTDEGIDLTVNSMAHDLTYSLFRKTNSGAETRISVSDCCYPSDVIFHDQPNSGTYSYYVVGTYIDSDGESQEVTSNTVSVTFTKKAPATEYCELFCYLKSSNRTVYENWIRLKCICGDEVMYSYPQYGGCYYFKHIPLNKTVIIVVEQDSRRTYENKIVVMNKKSKTVEIVGTLKEGASENAISLANDLKVCSPITWENNSIKFDVKSLHTRSYWHGYIIVDVVEKDKADKQNLDITETPPVISSIRLESTYLYIEDKSIGVTVPLSPLGKFRKDKEYYFIFQTSGYWTGQSSEKRPLAIDEEYGGLEGGYVFHKMEKGDYSESQESVASDDAAKLANLLVRMCSKVNGMDGHFGDLSPYSPQIEAVAKNISATNTTDDFEKLVSYIDDHGVNSVLDNSFFAPACTFIDFNSTLVGALWNTLLPYCKTVQEATSVLTALKDIHRFKNAQDDYEKYFICASAIFYGLAKYVDNVKMGAVFSAISTYIDIGDALAQAALNLGESYYDIYSTTYWQNNAEDAKKGQINAYIDFKIKIKKGWSWMDFEDFTASDFAKMIDYAKIHFTTFRGKKLQSTQTINTKLVGVDDGIMLKQTGIESVSALDGGDTVGRMWMEIKWANGRTSLIPLMKKSAYGIDYKSAKRKDDVYLYTVNFKTSNSSPAHVADDIHLKD